MAFYQQQDIICSVVPELSVANHILQLVLMFIFKIFLTYTEMPVFSIKILIYWISHLLSVSKTLHRAIFKYLRMFFYGQENTMLMPSRHITTKPVSSFIMTSPDSRRHIQKQMFLKSIRIKSVAPKTPTAITRIYIECTSATKDKFKILPL